MTLNPSHLEDGSVHQPLASSGSGAWRAMESSSPDDGRAVVAHQVVRLPASLFVDLGGHRRGATARTLCPEKLSASRASRRVWSAAGSRGKLARDRGGRQLRLERRGVASSKLLRLGGCKCSRARSWTKAAPPRPPAAQHWPPPTIRCPCPGRHAPTSSLVS